jgi:hypothetical protein
MTLKQASKDFVTLTRAVRPIGRTHLWELIGHAMVEGVPVQKNHFTKSRRDL